MVHNPLSKFSLIAYRIGSLSVITLLMLSLAGCWRSKKCCKTTEETVHIERVIEETPCATCSNDRIITEQDIDFEDEPVAVETTNEHVQERSSGPRGWGVK